MPENRFIRFDLTVTCMFSYTVSCATSNLYDRVCW